MPRVPYSRGLDATRGGVTRATGTAQTTIPSCCPGGWYRSIPSARWEYAQWLIITWVLSTLVFFAHSEKSTFGPRFACFGNGSRGCRTPTSLANGLCACIGMMRYVPPTDRAYPSQRKFFDALGKAHGVQVRLGHQVVVPDVPGQTRQKGVDTLLTLDLVRLAGRADCTTAILVITDRDFVEAIRAAQGFRRSCAHSYDQRASNCFRAQAGGGRGHRNPPCRPQGNATGPADD